MPGTRKNVPFRRYDEDTGAEESGFDDFDVDDDAMGSIRPVMERYDAMAKNLRDAIGKHEAIKSDRDEQKTRADGLKTACDAKDTKIAELTSQLAAANTAKSTAEGKADAEKARADLAEKARNDALDPVVMEAVISERMRVLKAGQIVLGTEFKIDAADKDLSKAKAAIVGKHAPETAPAKLQNSAYVAARFDSIVEDLGKVHVGLLTANLLQNLHAAAARPGEERTDADADDMQKKADEYYAKLDKRRTGS